MFINRLSWFSILHIFVSDCGHKQGTRGNMSKKERFYVSKENLFTKFSVQSLQASKARFSQINTWYKPKSKDLEVFYHYSPWESNTNCIQIYRVGIHNYYSWLLNRKAINKKIYRSAKNNLIKLGTSGN